MSWSVRAGGDRVQVPRLRAGGCGEQTEHSSAEGSARPGPGRPLGPHPAAGVWGGVLTTLQRMPWLVPARTRTRGSPCFPLCAWAVSLPARSPEAEPPDPPRSSTWSPVPLSGPGARVDFTGPRPCPHPAPQPLTEGFPPGRVCGVSPLLPRSLPGRSRCAHREHPPTADPTPSLRPAPQLTSPDAGGGESSPPRPSLGGVPLTPPLTVEPAGPSQWLWAAAAIALPHPLLPLPRAPGTESRPPSLHASGTPPASGKQGDILTSLLPDPCSET